LTLKSCNTVDCPQRLRDRDRIPCSRSGDTERSVPFDLGIAPDDDPHPEFLTEF